MDKAEILLRDFRKVLEQVLRFKEGQDALPGNTFLLFLLEEIDFTLKGSNGFVSHGSSVSEQIIDNTDKMFRLPRVH